MGTINDSAEFKGDAVHQIHVRGYPVREISRRLGVSSLSLQDWTKLFAEPSPKALGLVHEAETRELARVTEEHDILEEATAYLARESQ